MLIQRNYFKRQFSQVSCKESLFNVLAKLSKKDPFDLHSKIAREYALDPPTHPSTLTQPPNGTQNYPPDSPTLEKFSGSMLWKDIHVYSKVKVQVEKAN